MNQLRQLTKQSGVGHGSNGGGRKFFASTSRGEISELAADLNSNDRTKERYAIKRIIATMTLGRDVSRLFPDVVKLSRTTNLEIKKLVYLYIVTNARLASDKAILAVNTFVQDAQYDHPAIRALALRTMLCLRVEGITDYTIPPLRKALRDVDPYVRRTAAIGLGKFYHQSPHLFEQQNFFVEAISLISDASPMVVAAAASTVDEILQSSPNSTRVDEIQITDTLVRKMLTALPECVEWGQCRILALVSHHCPKNHTDAESLIERLLLLLSHTSVCIVLAVGKVVINLLERVALNSPVRAQVLSKVSNAYVTLLGLGGETISAALQYVVCRDVYILNYKYPAMFVPHIRSFLIRFNDPTYLKLEKLNIMIRLLTTKNTAYVTAELIQYSNDLDVAFVSAVIRAFGVVALVDDIQVGACIEHLFAIAFRGGTMRYNEVICVLKDILRRYPQHHDLILPKIFGTSVTSIGFALESLIENTEALQAGLWMLGEFNMHIEHAPTVLGNFLAAVDVLHLGTNAQLTLLTTTVKVFNSHPAAMEQLICSLLDHFIMNAVCPDVQERAILYYRLLSHESGAQILSKVVMGVLPVVSPDSDAIDPMRLNDFIRNLNSVASVIRQPPEVFVPKYGLPAAHESYQTDSFDESGELSCEEPHFIIGTSGESDASVGLGNRASHDEGNSINISSTLLGSNDNPVHPSLNGSRQANTSSNEKNLQSLTISDTKNDVPTNRDDTFDAQRRAQISTLDVLDDIFGGSSTPSSSHNMTTITKALKSGHETRIRGTPQNLDELFSSETPSTGLVVGSTTATTDDSPKGVDSLGSCNSPSLPVILRSSHIPGFYIQGGLVDVGTSFAMGLELHFYYVYDDSTMAPPPCALKDFGIQVNRNALGLKTISPLQASMPAELLPMPCQPHSSTPSARHRTTVALQFVEAHFDRSGSFSELQVALKTNLGVDYFVVSVPIALVYRPLTEFSKKAYMNVWKSLDVQKEKRIRIPLPPTHGAPGFHTWLEAHVKQTFRAIVVSERSTPLQVHFYLALETHGGDYVLVELVFLKEDAANCFACIKAKEAEVQARILESLLNVVFTCPASGKIDHS